MENASERIGADVRAFIEDESRGEFGELALRIFRYQLETNAPYCRFCEIQGIGPGTVTSWREIPPVPAGAFKEVPLTCGGAEVVFRTSGTTRGRDRRGEHHVHDRSLYHLSLTSGFRRFVLPDRDRMRIFSLIPTGSEQVDSSLSTMADVVLDRCGAESSGTFVGENRILTGSLISALHRSVAEREPVLLMGTTLAFMSFLDSLTEVNETFVLSEGSRLMDTGGPKGTDRVFEDENILSRYERAFGIPAAACVNEYGMTELLSQLYNDDLTHWVTSVEGLPPSASGIDRRIKHGPHWIRSRVLDPDTLEDAERGVVAHVDLANCHSVVAVLTEDVGLRQGDAILLEGRGSGAPSRGCSIAMDEWLR